MNFNPCDDQFVFVRRQFTCQECSVKNRVYRYFSLIIRMYVWHMVFLGISKKHTYENPIKHGNRWHTVVTLYMLLTVWNE